MIIKLETNRAGVSKKMQSNYECSIPNDLKDLKLDVDSEIQNLIN
ncbi:hypothetical protein J2Z72_000295 [Peptostreptococcus canis]|nr:hypothetical protein [Peptostreptococcus canis]